ncbi:alpha/beta hydrolase, partial [Roseateles sp.]|uniref:alpha/beta hydrolase n=1 Tax=Roseateles sp. TaxID=1971397 RepID=UPI002F41C48A
SRELRAQFGRFWATAQGTPREVYDRFIGATPMAPGVTTREVRDAPLTGWWCEPVESTESKEPTELTELTELTEPTGARTGRAILFLHGGGYGLGHAGPYAGFVSQIVARSGVPAFAPEYPLAPEAQWPTARDLAVSALAALTERFESVAVVGDSAGGGLSFATVLEARRRGLPVAAIATFSPWTDLSLSGESANDPAVVDPLLAVDYLRASAAAYLGATPADDPRASPLFETDLRLPPTLIQVGADEVLRDDSIRMARAAEAAGTDVELQVWQGMHHVFQLNTQELASARLALDRTAEFLVRHLR